MVDLDKVSVIVWVIVVSGISVVTVIVPTNCGWTIAVMPAANMAIITTANAATLFSNL